MEEWFEFSSTHQGELYTPPATYASVTKGSDTPAEDDDDTPLERTRSGAPQMIPPQAKAVKPVSTTLGKSPPTKVVVQPPVRTPPSIAEESQ